MAFGPPNIDNVQKKGLFCFFFFVTTETFLPQLGLFYTECTQRNVKHPVKLFALLCFYWCPVVSFVVFCWYCLLPFDCFLLFTAFRDCVF